MFKLYSNLTKAIDNEIAIDKEVFHRSEINDFSFIPIRPLKSAKHLIKIPGKKAVYLLLNIFFLLLSPIFFGYQCICMLVAKLKLTTLEQPSSEDTVVLVANSRTVELFQKNLYSNYTSAFYINFTNQNSTDMNVHILQYISSLQIIKCYFFVVFYTLAQLPMLFKLNILQCYVSLDWLVKYKSLLSISLDHKQNIYFSNHYDRWAVMFHMVLSDRNLHLVQHGVLSENLVLPYKLTNLKHIHTLDSLSQNTFILLFDLKKTTAFYLLKSKLCLMETIHKNSVLIIGQPQSAIYEIEILQELVKIHNIGMIFIKPHPLYSIDIYKRIKSYNVTIIDDKLYFPKVSVALNFESTLGLEYQNAGIPVIAIKNKLKSDIVLEVKKNMLLL